MRTEKSLRSAFHALAQRFRRDSGEVSSWLIMAAGLTAAAVLASAVIQTTVRSLADEVAVAAGSGASAQPAGAPGAPGNPATTGNPDAAPASPDLGAPPTIDQDLTVTSRQSVVDGEEFLILEVADGDGNVAELTPIQLRSNDSSGQVSGGGAGDMQPVARPRDALDDYTIEDYVDDQAALGNDLHPITVTASEAELDAIKEAFADSDPATRERVLEDIRNGGTAPVASLVGMGAEALPQDHYQDNLLGLIADTLFGWARNRGRTPPPSLPIDRGTQEPADNTIVNPTPIDTDGDGVPNPIDPDYNPTPNDTDGDGIPDLIDRDTQPADPFDLNLGDPDPSPSEPVTPANPSPNRNNNTDGDTEREQEQERGTTSNPGNPDNPAGEPDECHGSCA